MLVQCSHNSPDELHKSPTATLRPYADTNRPLELNVVFFESGRQQVTLVSKQISGRIETTGGMAGTLIRDEEQLGRQAAARSWLGVSHRCGEVGGAHRGHLVDRWRMAGTEKSRQQQQRRRLQASCDRETHTDSFNFQHWPNCHYWAGKLSLWKRQPD